MSRRVTEDEVAELSKLLGYDGITAEGVNKYLEVMSYAEEAHRGQMYGDKPYFYHLENVASFIDEYYGDAGEETFNLYIFAAYLHDVIEDTSITKEEIEAKFGLEVANIVWACTGVGSNRKERQECIKQRILLMPKAAPVKCADRLANLEEIIRTKNEAGKFAMYAKEHESFASYIKPHVNPYMWEMLDLAIQFGKEKGWAA